MTKLYDHTNRLIRESSPYLLQHAHNPVDWYAWGPEAFAAARELNKPIFLSVGYSTCYWCHVMERQSFENASIAALMSEKFICIKVDREERPDVDQLYMTAVQVMTGQGGWPMSVFLTQALEPFWGGTYFPPTDAYGRPGFPTVLNSISDHFHNKPHAVRRAADELVKILKQNAEPQGASATITIDDAWIDKLIQRSVSDYDPAYGGFGRAPKFPRETMLELLLHWTAKPRSGLAEGIFKLTRHALDAMANGGIRDHLGGAFHRYSTDAEWLVPHFEIMLYDNAMLGWCYVEAFRQTGEPRYATVARGIFDFVLREMTSSTGAFFTAFDAEVDAQEGLSYLWVEEEIDAVLGVDAERFKKIYGMDDPPNFADPHHGGGPPDKYILHLPHGAGDENDPAVVAMRQRLYEVRRHRKQPLLDTKILTSWSALMIRALAYASNVFGEERYRLAAEKAASFLLEHHRKPDGGLYRTSRLDAETPTSAKLDGYLDDYAFLIQALLELSAASANSRWREAANELAGQMNDRFCDTSRGDASPGGFYFTDRGSTDLIVRQKTGTDSPLPSGNAIAAMAMLDLGQRERAANTIALFANQMNAHGEGMSAMVQAAMRYIESHGPLAVKAASNVSAALKNPDDLADSVVETIAEWRTPKELKLQLTIAAPYHINTHQPTGNFVATQMAIMGAAPAHSIVYPPGEPLHAAFSDETVEVYQGRVEIAVKFVQPVATDFEISLRYQACDQNTCLSPVTRHWRVPAP